MYGHDSATLTERPNLQYIHTHEVLLAECYPNLPLSLQWPRGAAVLDGLADKGSKTGSVTRHHAIRRYGAQGTGSRDRCEAKGLGTHQTALCPFPGLVQGQRGGGKEAA